MARPGSKTPVIDTIVVTGGWTGAMAQSLSAQNHPGPEESDLRMIELLDSDPRMTYTEVAAHLGVSRARAKAMMDRLYKRGARTVCYVDEWVKGYVRSVAFFINTATF